MKIQICDMSCCGEHRLQHMRSDKALQVPSQITQSPSYTSNEKGNLTSCGLSVASGCGALFCLSGWRVLFAGWRGCFFQLVICLFLTDAVPSRFQRTSSKGYLFPSFVFTLPCFTTPKSSQPNLCQPSPKHTVHPQLPCIMLATEHHFSVDILSEGTTVKAIILDLDQRRTVIVEMPTTPEDQADFDGDNYEAAELKYSQGS